MNNAIKTKYTWCADNDPLEKRLYTSATAQNEIEPNFQISHTNIHAAYRPTANFIKVTDVVQ